MPEETQNNQEDDGDAIERFGTTPLLSEWRTILKGYSKEYSDWLKKSKSFQQKIINLKQSVHRDVLKISSPLGLQARQLNGQLLHIPCSTREADDFTAFFEAATWVTDLLEVRTFVRALCSSFKSCIV